MFPPGSKQSAVTWNIMSTIGSVNSPSFTGPSHSTTSLSSHHLCLDLPTILTGWVPTPTISRQENVCWVQTLMGIVNWPGGPLRKGGKLPLSLTSFAMRYEVVLTMIGSSKLTQTPGVSWSTHSISFCSAGARAVLEHQGGGNFLQSLTGGRGSNIQQAN